MFANSPYIAAHEPCVPHDYHHYPGFPGGVRRARL